MFPIIQNDAKILSIEPRRDLGWNSAKYDQVIGMLPPTLKEDMYSKCLKTGFVWKADFWSPAFRLKILAKKNVQQPDIFKTDIFGVSKIPKSLVFRHFL